MTSRERAEAIMTCKSFVSREVDHSVYFSNRPDGQTDGYGEWFVLVDVAEQDARLDDEFPDGEKHYAVRASDISAGRILRAGPVASLPHRTIREGFPVLPKGTPGVGEWLVVFQETGAEKTVPFRSQANARRHAAAGFSGVVSFAPYKPRVIRPGVLVRESLVLHNGQPAKRAIRKAVPQS